MKHAADWNVHGHKVGAHAEAWTWERELSDAWFSNRPAFNPGRHIAPVAPKIGRHDARRPVTYDAAGTTTPLNPPTHALDAVA